MTGSPVGTSAPRARDRDLVAGRGTFLADVERPGQVYARVVRSPVAHATLAAVHRDEALAAPGVLAVLDARDVPAVRIPIRLPFAATPNAERALQPLLAAGRVRYVGEPVAVVVADDPWHAEDAAELVRLDLDPLEAAVDPVTAVDAGAPVVEPALDGNVVDVVRLRYGDVAAAFAQADVVVRRRLSVQRQAAAPLETRGLVAEHDPETGVLTVWGAAKVKHFNRRYLAAALELDVDAVRLVEVDVGGGFGVRGELYPEDVLVPLLALRLGRPVKWVEDRAEHFVATNHAREQVHELAVAARADGTLLAFEDRAWCDQGAYVRTQGLLPAILPAYHLPGPYLWDAFSIDAHAVLTHRTPVGTYRGPGMTEATFVRERMLDLLAAELRLEPVDLRRRNLVPAERMPLVYPLEGDNPPIVYETGDFPAYFEHLLGAAGPLPASTRSGRARTGVGVAAAVEMSGIGPYEDVSVEARPDGSFVVRAGIGSVGQGVETALAQIVAAELGAGTERVDVRHHDTADVAEGFGTFASRSTVLAGNAAALAARELRGRAGAALGVEAADVDADRDRDALVAVGPVTARFEKDHPSFSFGAALSVVRLDAETGRVEALRHVVAHDVGRAINPALVAGQLTGAAAQGIGAALYEELPYDEAGNPLHISFADYALPTLLELPEILPVAIEQAPAHNPLGIKGAGEAGMVTAPAATANAVADALGAAGGAVDALPLTPLRLLAALQRSPPPA